MRSFIVAAIFMAGAFAGCAQTETPFETTTPAPTPSALPPNVVVIGSGNPQFEGEIPTFAERYVANQTGIEPTLGFTQGALFYVAVAAGSVVMKSVDEGVTWTDVTPSLPTGQPRFPTTNDPYLWTDPVTDNLYLDDMYALACSFLQWSTDDGASWLANPAACGVPVNDHQTLFSGPAKPVLVGTPAGEDRILYYCWNAVAYGGCSRSVDGGATWTSGAPTYRDPVHPSTDPAELQEGVCGSLHGHGRASESTGTVFVGKAHCGVPYVSLSRDNGLTWTQIALNNTIGASGHDVSMAIDAEGNVYAFWLDARLYPRLAVSHDDGSTWGPALNVSIPGVNRNAFPSIVAGDGGRIAFNYWGTSVAGGFEAEAAAAGNATWNSYVGISINADTADPVFVTSAAHDPADPLLRGDCYVNRCEGAYDFMDIAMHPVTGQIAVAMVDLCFEQCREGVHSSDENINRAAIGIQVGGTRLRA